LGRRGGKLWACFPPQLPVDGFVGGFRFKGGVMSSEKNSTLKYAIVLNSFLGNQVEGGKQGKRFIH
jgi:hypothetical protein